MAGRFVESCERRQLLAAAWDAGRLLVEGTGGNDRITVAQHPGYLNVIVAAVNGVEQYFQLGAVTTLDVRAGDGNDVVRIDDSLEGLKLPVLVKAGAGNDRVYTLDGDDTILGDAGHDRIDAGAGNDVVSGGAGNDRIRGYGGADTILGDAGSDRLEGNADADLLRGGSGNDALFGGSGTDTLKGESGDDNLYGGEVSEAGRFVTTGDHAEGGGGADWFDGATQWTTIDFKKTEDRRWQNQIEEDPVADRGYGGVWYGADTSNVSGASISSGIHDYLTIWQPPPAPSLHSFGSIGYLYDGVSDPSENQSSTPTSATPAPIDLSLSQRKALSVRAVTLPAGWKLMESEARQGDFVWFRLHAKNADSIRFDGGWSSEGTYRFLVVRRGTVILPSSSSVSSPQALTSTHAVRRLRYAAGDRITVAGYRKPLTMSAEFSVVPSLGRGQKAVLVDQGVIRFSKNDAPTFEPFAT
jgi:hypothetical protein